MRLSTAYKQRSTAVLIYGLLFFASCRERESVLPIVEDKLSAPIRPSHFPEPVYQFGKNTYSKAGFELGRKLFFDPMLSSTGAVSCGSCHQQKAAFTDGGKAFSNGVNGGITLRNSPVVFNMAWNNSFMWDGGVNHIEVMPLAPLTQPNEMGETITGIVRKLNAHSEYPSLFRQVFARDTIDDQQMFWALAQYMGNLVSANTAYDRYVLGTGSMAGDALEGLVLFREHCASCHKEPLFTDYSFQNNGIDSVFADAGRYRITTQPDDMGKFKVPTLRNIDRTGPYMHDGRFNTLNEVLAHYANGVKPSATLSPFLNKHVKPGLPLSNMEQAKIIAFLRTLTDEELLTDSSLVE